MSTLLKRSNGIFYYVRTDDTGRRRWLSTGKKNKAQAIEHIRQMEDQDLVNVARCTLSDFMRDFLAHAGSVLAPGTVGIYRRSLTHFIEIIGNMQLSAVNYRHVDAFTSKRIQQAKPVTVGMELRSLRAAFYTALRWELIQKNPFTKVRVPRVEENAPRFLTRTELTKLIEVIPADWYRALVMIAVLTGMRRAELLHLTWANVDFEHHLLRIQSQGTFRTKTGKRRFIPLNQTADGILRVLHQNRKGDYIFSPDGKLFNPQNVSRSFKTYVERAGLEKGLHFHSLRHTFATWLVQDGVSIYHVQRLLGHSTIRVTEMYSHLVADDLSRSVARIQLDENWNSVVGRQSDSTAEDRLAFDGMSTTNIIADVHPFSKLQADVQWIVTLPCEQTISPHLRFGFSKSGLPIYEQFRIGGPLSLPGYHRDEVWGKNSGVVGLRHRMRLYKRWHLQTTWTAGNVYESSAIALNNLKKGVSIGLAALSPIGPFAILYGWGEGNRKQLYVNIGYDF